MSRFEIGEADFLLDGAPFRMLAGALHYFRVHPRQWRDRVRKARHLGLNTIETYVAWNAHSPRRDTFDTHAALDLGHYLDVIADEGMYAFVRPGPYICAEWDNGGLPAWLFRDPATGIRRNEPMYLDAVGEYLDALAPILAPRQIDDGGPIILVQVENEYGAYGDDPEYLRALVERLRKNGITVPLTTVDQPDDAMLSAGSLPELHKTASFGSRPIERLTTLRRHQPRGPLVCAEFWDGWFDHWGEHHHTTSAEQSASDLDALLSTGASVNLYMFHGGTNFGFTNGANDKGSYAPIVTSYDYDAPLDEAGQPTPKYWAFREVISRHVSLPPYAPVDPPPYELLPRVALNRTQPLWNVLHLLGSSVTYDRLPTADDIEHYSGFTLYTPELPPVRTGVLMVGEVRDRALVFVDRQARGVLNRDHADRMINLDAAAGATIDILVEDQGRVNYGSRIGEPKGLIEPATVDGHPLSRWTVQPLDLSRIEPIAESLRTADQPGPAIAGPAFASGHFDVSDPDRDLFLDTAEWGKGVVWINGFCLGRYWSRGPQRTLYIPSPILRDEGNEIVIMELHAATPFATLVTRPELGPTDA